MSLTEHDIERIADAVSRRPIHELCIVFENEAEKQLHEDQHEWLRQAIRSAEAKEAESKAKREFWKNLLMIVIQYSIPAMIGGVIYWVTGHKPT